MDAFEYVSDLRGSCVTACLTLKLFAVGCCVWGRNDKGLHVEGSSLDGELDVVGNPL